MKQDDLKSRYAIKLISSVAIVLLNGGVQIILPRALSVEEYGYYSYNLNVFTSIVNMANMSVSGAMVSKFSKRNEDRGLLVFYLFFYGIIAVLLNIGVIILFSLNLLQSSFEGQTLFVVLLALEVSILSRFFVDNIGIYDAMAIARFPAVSQIIMRLLIAATVIFGYLLGNINLVFFYITQISVTSLVTAVMLYAALTEQKKRYQQREYRYNIKKYAKEYYIYCRPLIGSSIFSQFTVIFMNWALMKWSGAVQQAQFGAAWQLNTLVTYIFSPYADLMRREFAIVYNKLDLLKHRFLQSMKLVTALTSFIVVFICIEVKNIIEIVYGDKYIGATSITVLIMLYTIFQSWGQIEGSYLYATENTKTNARIIILGQALTVIFVFLFQIPNFIWPKTIGGIGIALNYLLVNIISVETTLFIISRKIGISFLKYNMFQIVLIIFLGGIGIITKLLLEEIWQCATWIQLVLQTISVGIVYTVTSLSLICIFPRIIGMSKNDKNTYLKKIIRR